MESSPAPDRAALQEAALRHLARYSATEVQLRRVLERRVIRWRQATGADEAAVTAALAAAREVAAALAVARVVDDAAFAAARTHRLVRGGRSRRVIAAHLVAKGVDPALAATLLPGADDELAAAVVFARARRLGPFRPIPADEAARRKELGAMARAGFPRGVADQALALARDAAEAVAARLKQG